MLHDLIRVWFGWVEHWGYLGIFVLMAMESSIIPVPSEIVIPPAAFWASQGRFSFEGVIIAGTLGSYAGSIVSYVVSRYLGLPLVHRFGKYFLLSEEKLELGNVWIKRYGSFGIFSARLLPVIRHLISIPAGILKMPAGPFSIATLLGAGVWCTVLAWFGQNVIGGHPELLNSPEAMMGVMKQKLHWIVAAVLVMIVLYVFVSRVQAKKQTVVTQA